MSNPGYVEVVAGAAPSKDAVATAVSGLSVEWSALTVCVGPKRAEVLHGLTGRADRGALTAVLGPSGSGKSTLLRRSRRAERKVVATGGSLRYDGAAWSRSAHKRRLAFVEQEDTLLGDLTDTVGLLFLQPVYWGFQMMIQALFAFPPAHDVLVKERAAGLYSVSAFFAAATTVDTVSACLVSPLFSLLYYFAVGLRPAKLPWHCLVLFCNGLAAQSAGLAIGAWIADLKRAATFETVFMLTTMMCGGFYVANVPAWLDWLGYLSFTKYSFSAMLKIEFLARVLRRRRRAPRRRRPHGLNVQVLQKPLYVDVLALLAFAAGFRVLSFVGLKRNAFVT
ncbi:ABC transporter [Aureococcus anophagefferens]|uniref:ABC transporter n=1 Tax=Aureococcus anophagefferens TaxID=44056 RepID=A0ABR1G0V8_AURAN